MNPAFERALEARLLWMQVRSYGSLGLHREAGVLAHKAYRLVECLGADQARRGSPYGADCPALLSDVDRLAFLYVSAWSYETQSIEEEREEEREEEAEYLEWQREKAEEKIKQEQLELHATSCIERNDWEALDLPTPEHLSAELYAGKPMRVDGHFLHYEDGIIWMDNPYGVEGCLGEDPTIQLCRQFLTRIAKGGMYGPEP